MMEQTTTSPRRRTLSAFHPRHVDLAFDAKELPRYWYANDAFLTTLMDGLSLLFPDGERFFVEAVVRFRNDLTDPVLRDEVSAFAGQEGQHGKEHRAMNAMLRAQGFDVVPQLEREVRWILRTARKVLTPKGQLAVTCALEHFTAILAEQVLERREHRENIACGPLRQLWTWHALEESEHKSVAYDVYEAVGGGYVRRVSLMLLTTVIFVAEVLNVHARLLANDERRVSFRDVLRGQWHLWGRPGLFRRLLPAYATYFRPGFHPRDRDSSELVSLWRERLFGAEPSTT
jgi:predicted metal-dependent hydrolase